MILYLFVKNCGITTFLNVLKRQFWILFERITRVLFFPPQYRRLSPVLAHFCTISRNRQIETQRRVNRLDLLGTFFTFKKCRGEHAAQINENSSACRKRCIEQNFIPIHKSAETDGKLVEQKISSRFSGTVSHVIDLTVKGLKRDHPQAWELSFTKSP